VNDCFFHLVSESGVETVLTQGTFGAVSCDWDSFGEGCVTIHATMSEVFVVLGVCGYDGVLVFEGHRSYL